MVVRRIPMGLFALFMAVAAMIGMSSLSVMHNLLPHDLVFAQAGEPDEAPVQVLDDHDDHDGHGARHGHHGDSALHLAVHSVVSGAQLPDMGQVAVALVTPPPMWLTGSQQQLLGRNPETPLRPPRA
jgi:hypothetical protein